MRLSTAAAPVSFVLALCGSGCGTGTSVQPASKDVMASAEPAPSATAVTSASPAAPATSAAAPITSAAAPTSAPSASPSLLPGTQFGMIGVLAPNAMDPNGRGAKAKVTVSKAQVTDDYLPPDVVTRIVRSSEGRFRNCYGAGLANNPSLQGKVSVKLTITTDGAVSGVSTAGSSLPDSAVIACVAKAFGELAFPRPDEDTPVSIAVDLAP